ncbi:MULTISPECIES: indole-3-acetate monooxygenase [Pseudomonas]|jgi:indole-3-acetate monooxygenase|uniref:Flavin-dependent monooxygenase n=2 Tax=Pseudomonas veronii TaxID=76761 RepID=A0A7Y1AA76_PSEVE|nr:MULTISPECIES: indole-3-acetate monooxygenase [Pseudomonas]AQY65347.1 acyl-CoA dehydrogenase [Pseudomonas veronii]MBI6554084.1 flavin-dependent monooxygenase [Pseudomonas veronii]MBI6651862.1 flavin-dependent monooxygenase [Pseudomonas veronii]MBJ2176624.1 flavin-dependent monooxygenase [Pseudomonas veronii]MCI1736757.1 acyl-CoA dehydrogenase family protein [Pseudomonas veronii]
MTSLTLVGNTPSAAITDNQAFSALLVDIKKRARSGEFDRLGYIAQDVIDAFKTLGVYRALVPRRFGGDQCSPGEFCAMVEEISRADGSAGWVASFGMSPVYLASLPLDTIRQVYANGPDVVFAGGIFPPQPAEAVPGGFKVNGRWKYSSGCMGASLVGVGIAPKNGDKLDLPRLAVMPQSKVRIEQTWDTVGLLGTGSHDLVVEDVVVSEEWTFVRGGAANLDEPFFRYPSLSFATQVLSVVGLGVARAALDELRDMAAGRISVTGAPAVADRPLAQVEIAKAEAALRAARAFFFESIEDAWQTVLRGDSLSVEKTNLLRLSSTHATRVAAEVARTAQMLSGMTGVYNSSPLARCVNDAQVVTQHAFMGDITYQNAGAVFFGKQPLPGYL